jgi:hypothetical protein
VAFRTAKLSPGGVAVVLTSSITRLLLLLVPLEVSVYSPVDKLWVRLEVNDDVELADAETVLLSFEIGVIVPKVSTDRSVWVWLPVMVCVYAPFNKFPPEL